MRSGVAFFGSSGALVDDAPAPVLLDPVLALLHGVRQVARAVLLIETYEHEVFLARTAEHADVAYLDLDPALAAVDQSLVLAPCLDVLALGGEFLRVVRQVALRVQALPVGAPLLDLVAERLALARPAVKAEQFHLFADDDRRQAHLEDPRERVEVGVGEDHAAVARSRGPAVGVRRGPVQPDAVAVAALDAVPLVRVIDGESAAAVEVRKLFPRQALGDVIDADRGLRVALASFQRAV